MSLRRFLFGFLGTGALARRPPGAARDVGRDGLGPDRERQLAADIEAAARHWRQTFDALPMALVVLGPDQAILRANRPAADLLCAPVTALSGRKWGEFGEGEPGRTAGQLAETVRLTRRAGRQEIRGDDGTTWEVHADPARHGTEPGQGAVILSIREVTEVVATRERARRNESLAALGTVVAGVAHEVRNPVQAISMHLEALLLEGGLLPPQAESLAAMRTEVKRLDRLVRELFEYGRPHPVEFETLCMHQVLTSAADACRPLALARGVDVRFEASLWLPVRGDAERLRRVFVNLIENAVQHSAAGTAVEVSIRRSPRLGPLLAECRITDQGPGFAVPDLKRAFEPFFTRRRDGTGLGLPIVRRIVLDHGGSVEIGNRPEGGARALVLLPILETA